MSRQSTQRKTQKNTAGTRRKAPVSYNDSSEAQKLDYLDYYRPGSIEIKQPKTTKTRVVKAKKNVKPEVLKMSHHFPVYAMIFSLFVCSIVIVYAGSISTSLSKDIALNSEIIKEQQIEIIGKERMMSAAKDSDKIKEIAQNKLGMGEPAPHQIVYINVEQRNFIEYK